MLKSKLKVSEIKQEVSTVADSYKDEQILHSVIRILRRDIEKMNISTDEYPTANEVSMAVSMERMPLSLTKCICWLLDKKSFQDASEPYVVPHDKIRKIMVITECIFSISKDVFTPILYWSCCAIVPQFRIQATYRNTVLPWIVCFLWRSQAVFNQHFSS
jgi:hypothetical protein